MLSSRRSVARWTDAHPWARLEPPRAAALRGLQTRAVPAGVTVHRATELGEMIILNINYSATIRIILFRYIKQ